MNNYYHKTKDKLAIAFYELLQKKDVDSISISELCEYANFSRETFYYHFNDKYDLISWVYYAQVTWFLKAYYGKEGFQKTLTRILNAIKKIETFYVKGFSDYHIENLEHSMFRHGISIFSRMVDETGNGVWTSDTLKFIITYDAAAWVAIIKSWITQYPDYRTNKLAENIINATSDELTYIFTNYKR